MHLPARNCAPMVSAATGQIWQRGPPSCASLGSLGSARLNDWTQKYSASSPRHIYSFPRSGLGRDFGSRASGALPVTRPGCTRPSAVPQGCLEWNSTNQISKADVTLVPDDNPRAEKLLEKFEVQVLEQGARPDRQFLVEDGKGSQSQSGIQREKVPERMTKGKMSMTPSRLFKLMIPLTAVDNEGQNKEIKPITILIHPQQPLSYLERLIQLELLPIKSQTNKLRPPAVSFIALQDEDNAAKQKKRIEDDTDIDMDTNHNVSDSVLGNDGDDGSKPLEQRRGSREEDAEATFYSRRTVSNKYLESGGPERFVRWSQATKVGDFIRDTARTREFIVTIEGAPSGLGQIRVAVPSFNERTYYLRMRLRKISRRIQTIAEIKQECESLAYRGAQRVAISGFGILSLWWFTVYMLTFKTELGWDTMEPVTYLVSLSTLMGGYLWFLYHNRGISYKSALEFTISARQKKLYQIHKVDLQLWGTLIDDGNSLRGEIKGIAAEYDAEWDERVDEQDQRVTEVLKSDRRQKNVKSQHSINKVCEDDD